LRTVTMIGFLGALDEAIQSFMPYRHADMSDWAFDMLAATVSVTALLLLDTAMTRRSMESHSADQSSTPLE
jgi:VanZ family protein